MRSSPSSRAGGGLVRGLLPHATPREPGGAGEVLLRSSTARDGSRSSKSAVSARLYGQNAIASFCDRCGIPDAKPLLFVSGCRTHGDGNGGSYVVGSTSRPPPDTSNLVPSRRLH